MHRWRPLGLLLHPFSVGFTTLTPVFHTFLVAENIYSKTGIEKTVQSVCCLGPCPPSYPPATQQSPLFGVPLTIPASPFQSNSVIHGSSRNLQGVGEKLGPSHP